MSGNELDARTDRGESDFVVSWIGSVSSDGSPRHGSAATLILNGITPIATNVGVEVLGTNRVASISEGAIELGTIVSGDRGHGWRLDGGREARVLHGDVERVGAVSRVSRVI